MKTDGQAEVKLYIVGVGMGDPASLTVAARTVIDGAKLLVGAPRMLEPYRKEKRCVEAYRAEEIVKVIREAACKDQYAAVLMSGDSGFYSGTSKLLTLLREQWGEAAGQFVKVLPGISSLSYFCAKIGKPWEDVRIVSLHGVQGNLWQEVLTHEKVFAVMGGNTKEELETLVERGLGECVYGYVGENLSYTDTDTADADASVQSGRKERISEGTVACLAGQSYDALSVLYLENSKAGPVQMAGLPDESFVRGSVPMTKAEVRAVIMSKLCIRERDIVYDIGAGTGSVSVEMALAARRGKVFAVETEKEAVELCKLNRERFCLHNTEIIEGMAPDALQRLPKPDVAFIGGSKGRMKEIVKTLLQKNPALRLVISAVTVENTGKAFSILQGGGFTDVEAVQVQISRAKAAGGCHLMMAQNPVMILSAWGNSSA